MNMLPQPNLPRLHWSPVEPSWIVSIGLVILAALPHQIPNTGRRVLAHPIGALLFATLSAYVAWKVPVLGAAMFILLAGVILQARRQQTEPFVTKNLNKDRVQRPHTWLGEEVLAEHPKAIQQRTEDPAISYDEVVDHDASPWEGEAALDEHPLAIQDKPVGRVPEYDEGGASYGHR